jgi:hypothetical protein
VSNYLICHSVLSPANVAKSTLVSCRDSYITPLTNNVSTLGLSRFSITGRDGFFERWFKDNPLAFERINQLVRENRDIAENTRLPLIATLVAALIENGYEPTTRTEVYQQRLRLLLGDWDRVKGVVRARIHPKLKRRYLMHVAYRMHKEHKRNIDNDSALQIFASALGAKGRHMISKLWSTSLSAPAELFTATRLVISPSGTSRFRSI